MKYIMETQRLKLRKIDQTDFDSLCQFLKDIQVMYAWEHAFSDEQVWGWIAETLMRYRRDGFSYYIVTKKTSGEVVGAAGVMLEKVEEEEHLGIGYIFNKKYWHKGYAYESAQACVNYAFDALKAEEVTAQIRPENLSSVKVAEKLGMVAEKEFVKIYQGKEMTHVLYSKKKPA